MYPKAFTSAQGTIRVWAVALIAVGVTSVFIGVEVASSQGGGGGRSLYNVSYQNATESLTGSSGTAPMRMTTDATILIPLTNITNVTVVVTWQDQTISPLTNPAVSVTVTGPNGTGSVTNRVSTAGSPALSVIVPNQMPDNETIEASSQAEALALAGADNNATLGTGEWTVSLNVGGVIGPRPGGSISYSISVEVAYFVGTATRA